MTALGVSDEQMLSSEFSLCDERGKLKGHVWASRENRDSAEGLGMLYVTRSSVCILAENQDTDVGKSGSTVREGTELWGRRRRGEKSSDGAKVAVRSTDGRRSPGGERRMGERDEREDRFLLRTLSRPKRESRSRLRTLICRYPPFVGQPRVACSVLPRLFRGAHHSPAR